jgi:cytochrome d ubiquinol oxidase subunit II
MDLNTIWFVLITVLFTGFFLLEGFDYGVGILLPFLAKEDRERRMLINTIGPFWDGNEVWLITAGGAIFAAFPHWYATMFSGFYLALFLMLLALIVRAVGFEFRSKDKNPQWRSLWDWMIFAGSLLPTLLWGITIGNLMRGVAIGADMNYYGGLLPLLNPFSLTGGLVFVSLFTLHGANFLRLKIAGPLAERAQAAARRSWIPTVVLTVLFVAWGSMATDILSRAGAILAALLAAAALIAVGWFQKRQRDGWAFVMTALTIALVTVTLFVGLYPRVMISTVSDEWSLTIYNASSSDYTLKVMSIVALIFLPIVLLYQGWSYYVFRQRIGKDTELQY